MSKREQIVDIVESMLDYFEVDSYDDLDSLMQMELVTELEDCLDLTIPISIYNSGRLGRKAFIDAILEIYENE